MVSESALKKKLWEYAVLPVVLRRARSRLLSMRTGGNFPRIALVKQDCNEDLYCCSPETAPLEMLRSTLLRSGPIGLFTTFDARFFIVKTEADPECSVWKEKSDPLQWAPQAWFEAFRDRVPGRDHGQSQFARGVDEIDWSEFDLVVSVDGAVPKRIADRHPGVVWAYYVREIKAPSWHSSFEQPLAGQDIYLDHCFDPRPPRRAGHVVHFPYHFQRSGIFHELANLAPLADDGGDRQGVFVEYHTARQADPEQLRQLQEFGPVYAKRVEDDRFDPDTGERIPQRSMDEEGFAALINSKYHVKWDGRAIYGTAKVEAIAAGCLALSDTGRDVSGFMQSKATRVSGFESLLAALRRLEASPSLYRRELRRQRALVDYLCYYRPANQLIAAWRHARQRKNP